MTLAAPVAGVMTMSPGDTVADTGGPVDNERGSHRDWSDPAIIYYPTLTVGILHKASEATAPSTPRLQGPSSVLWWEDTPETVSKVREGRGARGGGGGGGSITSVGETGWPVATQGRPECKTLTKYFVSSAGSRQGQDRSQPQREDRSMYLIFDNILVDDNKH